jgi:hypothetical protein
MGIEPTNAGATIRCVNHFADSYCPCQIYLHNMAVVAKWLTHRIVAPAFVGSIQTMPLCKWWRGADSNCRTRRSGFTVRRV